MKLLSSSATFAWKCSYPVICGIFLVWLIATGSIANAREGALLALAGPLLLMAGGSVFYGLLTWNLADEVVDEGDGLRITRRGIEAVVPLERIVGVSRSLNSRPSRVVLEFNVPTPFGGSIAFLPARDLQDGISVDVAQLVWQRAEAARAGA